MRRGLRSQRSSGGGGSTSLVLRGVTGHSAGNTLITSGSPSGLIGHANGFYVAGLGMVTTQAVSSATRMLAHNIAAGSGWDVQITGTYGTIVARCFDGATSRNSPSFTFGAGLVNQVFGWCMRVNPSGNGIELWVNRVKVTGATAFTTTATVANGPTGLGCSRTGGNHCDNGFRSFGICGGYFVPTQANIEAWFDACKSGLTLAAMPGGTEVARWPFVSPLANPVEDVVGSADLVLTGSLTLVELTSPTWAW
jgi:hypothetical protein